MICTPSRDDDRKEFDLAFVPCLYKEEEQEKLVSELISTARTTRTNANPDVLFVFLMLRWAAAIKHEGFQKRKNGGS